MSQNIAWEPYSESSIWNEFLKTHTTSTSTYKNFATFFGDKLKANDASLAFFNNELAQLRAYTNSIQNHHNHVSWGLYYFLCLAGGVYALCSGFDGSASVITLVMPELHLGLLFGLSSLSALCALGVFIARDKPSIMQTIELSYNPYHSLADEYLFSIQIYNDAQIQEKLQNHERDFKQEHHTANILKIIYAQKSTINQIIKQSWWVQLRANVVMGIGAILFFSDGFFLGESMAMLLSTMLAVQSMELVLFTSLVLGAFALAAYWYVERSSLKAYLYDNVSTDDDLLQERDEVNEKNLTLLNFFDRAQHRENSNAEQQPSWFRGEVVSP